MASWLARLPLLLLLVASPLAPAAFGDDSRALEARLESFKQALRAVVDEAYESQRQPDAERIAALFSSAFRDHVSDAALASASFADLEVAFAAAREGFFYSPAAVSPRLLKRIAAEMASRPAGADGEQGEALAKHLRTAYESLVTARHFEAAARFAQEHGIKPVSWEVHSGDSHFEQPTVLRVATEGDRVRLLRTKVDLKQGPRVVAVVHPHCGFSRGAMTHVESSEVLQAALSGRTAWITDQSRALNLQPLIDWNASADLTRIDIVYDQREWPADVGLMEFPVFYFLRDGELVDTVVGWPGNEQETRLFEALGRIGWKSGAEFE